MLDRTAIRLRISLYLDPGLPHSSLIHHFNPVFRFPDSGAQGSQTGEVINLLAHATDARFLSLSPLPVPPSEGCDISTGWAPWQQICAQMRADGSNTVSLDKKILSLFDITFKTCTVSTQMRINMIKFHLHVRCLALKHWVTKSRDYESLFCRVQAMK